MIFFRNNEKKMNEVLNELNFGPVRDFVKEAFEIEIFDEEEIFIFFAPLGIYLYHEGKLFSVHATETSDLDKNGEIAPINFIGYASYTALGIGNQNPFSGFDFSDPTHLVPKPF